MSEAQSSRDADLQSLLVRLRSAELDAHRLGLNFTAFLIGVAIESVTADAAEHAVEQARTTRVATFSRIKAAS